MLVSCYSLLCYLHFQQPINIYHCFMFAYVLRQLTIFYKQLIYGQQPYESCLNEAY